MTDHGNAPDGDNAPDGAAAPDAFAGARAIALRQLTGAPRTRAQLAATLRRKQVPDDVASAVLDRLSEVHLVDDEAFAQMWVGSRHRGRGLARRALAEELRRRGVEGDVVERAVGALDPDAEAARARELLARRMPGTRGLDPERRTRRLAGMLARKGYPSGLSLRLVREALQTEGDDLPQAP